MGKGSINESPEREMEVEFDDRDMQIADRLHCTVFGDIYLTPT